VGNCGLVRVINAVHVDIHYFGKLFGRLFEKGFLPAQDAGTANQYIEATKRFGHLIYCTVHLVWVGDIRSHIQGPLTQRFDIGDRLFSLFVQHVQQGNHTTLLSDA
jgi:hypothetical protein